MNDALVRQGRQSRDSLLGRTMMDAYPGIENTEMFSRLRQCMVDRVQASFETEFTFPDGSKGWFELRFEPVPEGLTILSVDITERKRAEAALRRSMRALTTLSHCNQTLVRATDEARFLRDLCTVIVDIADYSSAWIGLIDGGRADSLRMAVCSKSASVKDSTVVRPGATCTGIEPARLAILEGRPVVMRFDESDSQSDEWQRSAVEAGSRACISIPVIAGDTVVGALTIHSSDRDAFDEDETVLLDEVALDLGHGIATLRARRAQERVSAELNEQRARTRAIYDHLPHAAFVWRRRNETFSLIDVNDAARAATDSGVEQHLTGDSLGDFADLPHLAGDLDRCYSERGLVRREVACTLPGASRKRRFVLIYGYVSPDMVLLHAEDVTDLRQAQEQLAASQRLEAIGRLAGGVAHDFNNLLSVILSHAEFATQQLDESDPVRADVEQIRDAGLRAAELTRRLLAFSRKQVLKPKPLNLNDVVRGMESMLHRLLGEDVVIDVRLAAGLGTVMADPGQIEQVIMNLAVNSRQAMPDGGSLTIETADVESGAEAGAAQSDCQPGPWVTLTVTDTGHGMDRGTRTRVFEPFFTTRAPGAGTGLGLSTVYGIVQQSNGRIDVASEPGTGTRFTVCLPRIDAVPAEAAATQTPAPKTGTETILVAEDEEMVRVAVERILRAVGYTVIMAKDAVEAIRLCEQHDGPLHLLLTDLVMPGMNGRDLADRLRLQRPSLGILLMSGYAEESTMKDRAPENRLPFVGKPFTAVDLTVRVREVLDAQAGG